MIRHTVALGIIAIGSLVVGACGDALGSGDCPGAATDLVVKPYAPFWNGLVEADFKVPGGNPETVDVEIFDPAEKLWAPIQSAGAGFATGGALATLEQRDDGSYVEEVSQLPVSRLNTTMERKLRVRSRLQGCPVTDWTTSKGFSLGDPLVGTTWLLDSTTAFPNPISITSQGTAPFKGPFTIDPANPLVHSVTFAAGGTMTEELKFGIKSAYAGDPYNGCFFDLRFTGKYVVRPEQSQVIISGLARAANFADGSACNTPSLASMDLLNPQVPLSAGDEPESLAIDYSDLVASPPGHAVWTAYFASSVFSQTLQLLSVPSATQVSGSFYGGSSYKKQ